jgi:hypothetical protein
VGVMYQMRSGGESPALFEAKVPYLSGVRKVNHAEPVLGYAFGACIST